MSGVTTSKVATSATTDTPKVTWVTEPVNYVEKEPSRVVYTVKPHAPTPR